MKPRSWYPALQLLGWLWIVFPAALCAQMETGELYFENLYQTTIDSLSRAEKTEKKIYEMAPNQQFDESAIIDCANFFFISGSNLPAGSKEGVQLIKKSIDLYSLAWKQNSADPKLRLLLATAYTSRGADPDISVEEILIHIFRARNLYSMVLNTYPDNLDARLGRIRIQMNLTSTTGRSDKIHEADIQNFLSGYEKLPEGKKKEKYFKMALMEVRLAAAIYHSEKKQPELAAKYFGMIDPADLHAHALKLYKNLEKEIKA